MFKTILLVALGGAIGSTLRYLTALTVGRFFSGALPLATFCVNIIGCFLVGLFMGWLTRTGITHSGYKWFLLTGFCGGYTTFSAFALENINLLQTSNLLISLGYITSSIILGIAAVYIGLIVSQ